MAFFDLFRRKTAPSQRAPADAPPPAQRPAPPQAHDPVADGTGSPVHAAAPEPGPAVVPPEHDGPERRDRPRRPVRPGTRALVIDDSPTIVALLRRILRQNGFAVLEAFDAETGIEIARREVPDLVFLDIVLPGMDGFNALRALRRDPLTSHVPVIMISGNAQATEQFYVQRIGADDFMKKPFSRAEVCIRVEALLGEDGIPRHHARGAPRAHALALAEAHATPAE